MKRHLLPASALVLVVTACGAGAKPAPRVTELGARLQPNVRGIAARREHAAAREAKRLLGEFLPPAGARRIPEPRNYGGVLRRSGPAQPGESVDVHRFWSVRQPLKAVGAYLRTHRLHGFRPSGTTWGSRAPHYLAMSATSPAGARSPTRFLNVTSVDLPRRTLIRVDVDVGWTYPRSPREKVPSATSEIVVRAPKVSAKVTDPAQVGRIVRWFDALPVSPPGIAVLCALSPSADITLSFRSAGGGRLAQAKLPPTSASICDSIAFSIGGHERKPLIDRAGGASFAGRLQTLLGARLTPTFR